MYISLNVTSALIIILQCLFLLYLYQTHSNILVAFNIAHNNIDAMLFISGAAIATQVLILILFYFLKNKSDFTYMKLDLIVTKNIFSYSAVNFVITILFYLVMRTDIFFVEKFCSKINLSNYLQAAKIGQMLLVFPGLIAGVIFPYTIEAPKTLAHKVAFLCRTLTLLYLIVFFIFISVGKFIFPWLLGKDFNLMYEIFAISFTGIYCLSMSLLVISFFEGINKQKIIIGSFSAVLFFILIADYFLVPKYGYTAAAAIFSIANLIGLVVLLNSFKKETEIKFSNMFIVKRTDFNVLN